MSNKNEAFRRSNEEKEKEKKAAEQYRKMKEGMWEEDRHQLEKGIEEYTAR